MTPGNISKHMLAFVSIALLALLLSVPIAAEPVATQFGSAPDSMLATTALIAYPYLGETTPTSVAVAWATDTDGASEVRYSEDTSYDHTASASSFVSDGKYWHSATITGLTPDTTYHYRVYTGGVDLTPWSDISFSTAPETSATQITFAALGDSRPNNASADPNNAAWNVAAQVAQRSYDLLLHTGDIVYSGGICSGDDSSWEQYIRAYFDVYKDSIGDTPFYTAVGNHELSGGTCGYQAYTEVYHLPENGAAGNEEKYYSFDWGNVHVVVVDTETYYATGSTQYNWLENDLQSTSKPWKMAVFHQPAYSSGSHGSTANVQTYLVPLFESYGVDVVFNGHDHHYERTCPILDDACTTTDAGGVVYFVTGGAGGSIRSVGSSWFTAYAASRYHFMELTVDDCRLNIDVRDEYGVVFDSYEIDHCPREFAPQTGIGVIDDNDVQLSWQHVTQDGEGNTIDVSKYYTYRDTTPYQGDAATQAETVTGPFTSDPVTWTDADHIGNAATNYFYYVRAVTINGDQEVLSELSNHTGEFDFALTPGN